MLREKLLEVSGDSRSATANVEILELDRLEKDTLGALDSVALRDWTGGGAGAVGIWVSKDVTKGGSRCVARHAAAAHDRVHSEASLATLESSE